MAANYKVVQFRRGTTTQNDSFTGLQGEVTMDTEKNTLIVHDGSTMGGFPLRLDATTQDRPRYLTFRAALVQQGIPSLGFSASDNLPTPIVVTGQSGLVMGVASFSYQAGQSIQDHFCLPSDFVAPMNLEIIWRTSGILGSVTWQLETCCVPPNGLLENVTFNSPQQVSMSVGSPQYSVLTSTIEGVDITGYVPEGEVFFRLTRMVTDTLVADAELISLRFVILARSK